jgi:arylsulfatase
MAEVTQDTSGGSTDGSTGYGDPSFPGRIGRTFAGSEGWWPVRAEAPAGAPNVVVILVDDLGFADLGCYGSEIPTPNIDALAERGLRFTDFHATPMCSPSRAALLTGVDHHRAGVGTVAHLDPGMPGYASELRPDVATLAEVLGAAGWATFALGKWHLTKDSDCSDAGPRHSWPTHRGFDRFYGFLDAFTNLHHPHRLTEDDHQVVVDRYPDDYYFTDDVTDRAIAMIRERKASNPRQPFFCYLAHAAVHAPLHARAVDIERHRGRYAAGWDALRAERFARQVELGIFEPGTALPPRNHEEGDDVRPWDELSAEEQRLFARHMEVYAAMVEAVDTATGRLVAALDELGELEDTIIVFTSDNGASREGEVAGTSAYYVHLLQGDDVAADLERLDDLGGPRTTPHYPRGWAMASGTPFRLYKINTHAGGHSVPFIVHWPRGLEGVQDLGGFRRPWTYITDLAPTLLELCGVGHPSADGAPVVPPDGTSFAPVLTDPAARHGHTEQHMEMNGNRGYYRDGWEAVTRHRPLTPFEGERWELYHLAEDRTETADLAEAHPDRVAELTAAWERAARSGQVYPLDEGAQVKYLVRPERSAVYAEPVRIVGGTPTLERWRSVQLVWFRSCHIAIEVELAGPGGGTGPDAPAGEGTTTTDQGVLVAHGDQGGGYVLYVLDGHLHFAHNGGRGPMHHLDAGPVAPGGHVVAVDLHAPGGWRWDALVSVDGTARGRLDGLPQLFGMAPFEGIDVGIDRRSPVSWELFERFGPFPFTGRLHAVTYTPGEPAPDAPERLLPAMREAGLKYE